LFPTIRSYVLLVSVSFMLRRIKRRWELSRDLTFKCPALKQCGMLMDSTWFLEKTRVPPPLINIPVCLDNGEAEWFILRRKINVLLFRRISEIYVSIFSRVNLWTHVDVTHNTRSVSSVRYSEQMRCHIRRVAFWSRPSNFYVICKEILAETTLYLEMKGNETKWNDILTCRANIAFWRITLLSVFSWLLKVKLSVIS
jgi:hypothetical protein